MNAINKLVINGKYRHYKGNFYRVLHEAKHSETLEDMVIYRGLYKNGGIWARPKAMFLEDVEIDGVKQPRFKLIKSAKE
jgi:hypothetical protein